MYINSKFAPKQSPGKVQGTKLGITLPFRHSLPWISKRTPVKVAILPIMQIQFSCWNYPANKNIKSAYDPRATSNIQYLVYTSHMESSNPASLASCGSALRVTERLARPLSQVWRTQLSQIASSTKGVWLLGLPSAARRNMAARLVDTQACTTAGSGFGPAMDLQTLPLLLNVDTNLCVLSNFTSTEVQGTVSPIWKMAYFSESYNTYYI